MTIFCNKHALLEQCIAFFDRLSDIDVFCESVATVSIELALRRLGRKFRRLEKEPVTWGLGNRLLFCALRAPWRARQTLRSRHATQWMRYVAPVTAAVVAATTYLRISPRRSLARDRSKHPGRARGARRQVGSVGLRQCTGRRMPAQTSRPGYRGSTSHLHRSP